ncbi:hypothetical protein JOL62DRAFT_584240, partial [Phyllosticta paracitricarpa]
MNASPCLPAASLPCFIYIYLPSLTHSLTHSLAHSSHLFPSFLFFHCDVIIGGMSLGWAAPCHAMPSHAMSACRL